MRQVLGIRCTGRWGDQEDPLDLVIIADPDDPQVCEMCPAEMTPCGPDAPRHTVYTRDPDGICMCMTHSFTRVAYNRVETVEPRELEVR